MKILIVCQTYPPEVGAAPSRISNMAEGLVAHGHEVEVICGLPNYPKGRIFEGYRGCFSRHEDWNHVRLHRYWTYASNSSKALARMAMMFSLAGSIWAFALKRSCIRKFDLVILQTPPLPLATSAMMMLKKLYGKKIIINVSDIWPSTGVELGAMREGSLPYKVMAWMENYLYKNADAYQGQSKEIMDEIASFRYVGKPVFLYRNLQHDVSFDLPANSRKPFKIVYAGLLGVAQDLLEIIKHIDFNSLGAEMHLYGSGKQVDEIKAYIADGKKGVFYHGSLPKEEMVKELIKYNASIVPLVQRIHGAVPSKIFDLMPLGVPILFCGGGEGASIIKEKEIGYVSEPSDYEGLANNISKLISLSDSEYEAMRQREIALSKGEFSFTEQLASYHQFISKLD